MALPTIENHYQGDLRTSSTHLKSGSEILTDAPTDNNGKGEAFSPTDLVCSALTSCMMTIMGIVAEREGIDLGELKATTTKTMTSSPRKIQSIKVDFTVSKLEATDAQKEKLKRAAHTCPVALSLSSDVEQEVTFNF